MPSRVPTATLPDIVLPAGALAPAVQGTQAPAAALPGGQSQGAAPLAGNIAVIVIGDSIAAAPRGWPVLLAERWHGGRVTLHNHAIAGARITGSLSRDPLGGMEGQVAAAAGEPADTIIVALGTNDPGVTTTDLEILGSSLTLYLGRLRRDHAAAAIYVMGILPGVIADEAGRAAKQPILRAAARVRQAPFWETDGWINGTAHGEGADTIDGLHPDAAGHEKIIAHVLALLPR